MFYRNLFLTVCSVNRRISGVEFLFYSLSQLESPLSMRLNFQKVKKKFENIFQKIYFFLKTAEIRTFFLFCFFNFFSIISKFDSFFSFYDSGYDTIRNKFMPDSSKIDIKNRFLPLDKPVYQTIFDSHLVLRAKHLRLIVEFPQATTHLCLYYIYTTVGVEY